MGSSRFAMTELKRDLRDCFSHYPMKPGRCSMQRPLIFRLSMVTFTLMSALFDPLY
jgi:hypothetical protein